MAQIQVIYTYIVISMTTSTCNKANLPFQAANMNCILTECHSPVESSWAQPTVYQLQWVLLTVTLMCCISRSCCRCLKNSTDGGKQSNIRQARLKLCFTTAPSTGIEGWLLPMVLFTSCRDPTIRSLITAEWRSL